MTLDQALRQKPYLFEGLKHSSASVQHQLLHMGLIPGSSIQVLYRAPTGSPLQVRVGATTLSLRRELAQCITIQEHTNEHSQ